jgi:hypothetical protein
MKRHTPLLTFLHLTVAAFAQGPLTPPGGADGTVGPINALTPGGAPQATMKTLHQVEPRTAIPGGTATVTLAQRGAYYLTGDIVVSAGDGIVITASHVTLDLNGFSVLSSAAPAAGTGILLGDGLRNVAIRNGGIGGEGTGSFVAGVRYAASGPPQPPLNARVTDLSVSATDAGIAVGGTSQIERCLVSGGSQIGIVGTIVRGCVSSGGPISASIASQCAVYSAGTDGLTAQVVDNCVASSLGNAINAKCVVNSYATGGGGSDIVSSGVAQNVWAEGGSGAGDGIDATVVGNSYASRVSDLGGPSHGDGIRATVVHASEGRADYGAGIDGAVTTASRGRSSFDLGISAANSLVSHSFGSGIWGISADNGAIIGAFGTGNEFGILANSGLVTASHGRGISDPGIAAPSGHVTQSFGWTDTFSTRGLEAGSAIGSRVRGGLAFPAAISDLAQGVYGTTGVSAPLKFDSN